MPSGEVFTGPHEDSAEGHIRFTIPTSPRGVVVEDVTLEFREGRVVSARAERGDGYLQATLDTDAGARILGELGIGTNFGIDRPIGAILFDEKIGGTVHLALGKSYPETGGTNESVVHWDLICDLRQGGRLSADGDTILEDGHSLAEMRRFALLVVVLLAGCGGSSAEVREVDPFPLYELTTTAPTPSLARASGGGACTVFFAGGVLGRNFDFDDHPALLLHHRPPGAYRSVSLVDIAYLGVERGEQPSADDLAGAARLPFDGMNERGVAVAMAAVPAARSPRGDAVGSLGVMRLVLDRAANVAEAVAIFRRTAVDFTGGPPLHYMVADATGASAVIEYVDGRVHVLRARPGDDELRAHRRRAAPTIATARRPRASGARDAARDCWSASSSRTRAGRSPTTCAPARCAS